jgi:hypothetical protein
MNKSEIQCLLLGLTALLGASSPCHGQAAKEGKWVESTGEAVISRVTPERAQQIALNQARLNAVSQVNPIEITGMDYIKNMAMANKAVLLFYSGEIVEQSVLKWEVSEHRESETSFPELLCRVKIRAKVTPRGKPDPSFRLRSNLNRETFVDGDDIIIRAEATRDCYLTVLNWQYNDKIALLVPSPFKKDNFLEAHDEVEIPSPQERGFWRLTAQAVPGMGSIYEAIFVVATKEKVDFLLQGDEGAAFDKFPEVSFTEFQKWLSDIPPGDRTQAVLGYEVHEK